MKVAVSCAPIGVQEHSHIEMIRISHVNRDCGVWVCDVFLFFITMNEKVPQNPSSVVRVDCLHSDV
jgi:hypothetical protein